MAYLTYAEFKDMGLMAVPEDRFDGLLMRASMVLDQATRRYYQRHNLADDYSMRQTAFKQALALQIEYMFQFGVTTLEGRKQAQITSQSIGNTTISTSGNSDTPATTLLSDDAKLALTGTGLLYKGVMYAR